MSQSESDTDQVLLVLRTEFQKLEVGLNDLQQKYQTLSVSSGQTTSAALQESLSSLFKVILYVNKNDTSLVEWHNRSDKLKSALRLVGVDKRTNVLVEKKTVKIKTKVAKVEAKFVAAQSSVSVGLDSMHSLSKEMVQFSSSTVTKISSQTSTAVESCEQDCVRVQSRLSVQQKSHDSAQIKATKITASIEKSKTAQAAAKDNRDWHNGASKVAAVAAVGSVLGSLLFPPSLVITAPLLAVTAASVVFEGEYQDKLNKLESQERLFQKSMEVSKEKLSQLQEQLTSLGSQSKKLAEAKAEMEALQIRTSTVGREIQTILNDLRATRVMLISITAKLKAISHELQQCGYAQTRREIASKLHGTLSLIEGAAEKRDVVLKKSDARKATKALLGLTQRTDEVLKIMGVA